MFREPMFISPHVHALWPQFEIPISDEKKISRFVTSYVIEGEKLVVVDTSVASTSFEILSFIENIGISPEDIDIVINTHCHFDHVGGNGVLRDTANPQFMAHPLDIPYIEDLNYQMRVRPVERMIELCSDPIKVDKAINDGDVIEIGNGLNINVLHTPGHSAGSISLYIPEDGVLLSGDALPEPGSLPIYENINQTLASLDKLRELKADILLSAMSPKVLRGDQVRAHIDESEDYIRNIDRLIRLAVKELSSSDSTIENIGIRVLSELGIPEERLIPIVLRTFEAHLSIEQDLG